MSHSATNLSNYEIPSIVNSINVKSSFVTNKGSFATPTAIYNLAFVRKYSISISLCLNLILISILLILQYITM